MSLGCEFILELNEFNNILAFHSKIQFKYKCYHSISRILSYCSHFTVLGINEF
jgi:hypothetical protein